jgi:hypothetical protein
MANSRLGLRTRPGLIRNFTEGAAAIDADARLFIDATGITNTTIISAINDLCVDLKAKGIWDLCYAIWPLVSGTADTHKWNLKDARDLDAAYRMVFSGGWTHGSTGATANGTTAYGDTKFNISTNATGWGNDHHLAIYLRTQTPSTGDGWHIGVGDTSNGNPIYGMAIRRATSNTNQRIYDMGNVVGGNGRLTDTTTDARGFYVGSSIASNDRKLYRNGSAVLTGTSTVTGTPSNAALYLGSINPTAGSQFYLQGEFAFVSVGKGLTSSQVTDFNTLMTTFQTTLSRNV